ncbi:hypothetical protein MPER_12209, partial [Moniliophthora perniciosa FA553]
ARRADEKPLLRRGDEVLAIENGEFTWSKNSAHSTSEDINLTVRKGQLAGVLGRVGCGKTTLLSAILGDMTKREGQVSIYGSISYAPQNPWILSATVRQNILFFHEYDETFYDMVVEACALGPDLALLPNGDATEVGEKGITLSGGQRARIALARAVYARADLVLLDDCLAAVDSHVARHIFDRVIGPNGILSTKARILVTNGISFLPQFDQLLFIRRGIVLEQGSFGRILNLFSRDIYVVDQILARMFQNLIRTLATTLFIVIVIGASFPGIPDLHHTSFLVLFTSDEILSIYISGAQASRFRLKIPHFCLKLFALANQRRVDRNQICYLSSVSVNRWLSLRLELVGAVIIFLVAALAIVQLITSGVDAGLVGLVLSYALNATSSLNWVVRSASEVEQNMVAVERILHQIEVAPEAPLELPESKPAQDWPTSGEITFSNYSMRYRPELDLVLKNLSFTIKGKERVGICGRTGAGKSSIVQALYRIIEPAEGTIYIDSIDITKLGLHDLRSSCSTVPQNPELYEGTIRDNVDPVGAYPAAEIWDALEQAHLREFVASAGGLDTPVRE